jgi:uncharacterized protein (DUF433 family)
MKSVFARASRALSSIDVNPLIQGGVPVVKGTRIPLHAVLRAVEQEGSLNGAMESFPDLTLKQVKDALYFARLILETTPGGGIKAAAAS